MALDYSSLLGPTPESGANKGLSFFSNALDAVLQRRQQQEQERVQREQAEAHFAANMANTKEQAALQEANRIRDDARARAESKIKQDQFNQKQGMKDRSNRASAIKDSYSIADDTAANTYLQAATGAPVQPKAVDPALMQPIPQLPPSPYDDVDAGSSWTPEDEPRAAAAAQEAERVKQLAAEQEAVRGKYMVDVGGGVMQEINRRAMGPEGHADRLDQAATGMEAAPIPDLPTAMELKRVAQLVRAGAVKPELAGGLAEASRGRALGNAAAMDRAHVTGAARRDTLGKGEAMRGEDARVVAARNAYTAWEASEQVPALVTSYQRVSDMTKSVANVKAAGGSTIDQRKVLFNVAKELSGPGVLTKDDINTTVRNTGGAIAALLSKIATADTGELGEKEWEALERFVKNAKQTVRSNSLRAARNFKTRFNEKDHYRLTVPNEVESQYQALLGRLGVSEADVQADNEAKAKAKASAQAKADALLGRKPGAAK